MPSSYNPGGGIGGTTGTTDNAITRADGTGGSTLQGSLVTIDDFGNMGGVSTLSFSDTFSITNFSGDNYISYPNALYFRHGFNVAMVLGGDTLALRNGSNGQTWIVSRTFTDDGNKSEATLVCTGTVAAFTITEAGTGIGTLTKWTFNKNVSLPTLNISAIPTSSSGLSSGDVWSNLGILTIVA